MKNIVPTVQMSQSKQRIHVRRRQQANSTLMHGQHSYICEEKKAFTETRTNQFLQSVYSLIYFNGLLKWLFCVCLFGSFSVGFGYYVYFAAWFQMNDGEKVRAFLCALV